MPARPELRDLPFPEEPFLGTYIARAGPGRNDAGMFLRLLFTPARERSCDVPYLLAASRRLDQAMRELGDPHRRLAGQIHDARPFELPPQELPAELGGRYPVWVLDASLNADDFPDDFLQTPPYLPDFAALWLEEAGPGRLALAKRPAGTPTGRAKQRLREVEANGGRRVTAVLVQANQGLFAPGGDDLPCLIVFSFDREADVGFLTEMSEFIFAHKDKRYANPDRARVSHFVTDEAAMMYRRRRVPEAFTDGLAVYCADLWIHRPFLPDGYLRERELPCLAEPGSRGALELLPCSEW